MQDLNPGLPECEITVYTLDRDFQWWRTENQNCV